MKIKLLDTVVLEIDLTSHGLQREDVGTVVEVYELDGFEVEFITGPAKTQALFTLKITQVRSITDTDILVVRSFNAV